MTHDCHRSAEDGCEACDWLFDHAQGKKIKTSDFSPKFTTEVVEDNSAEEAAYQLSIKNWHKKWVDKQPKVNDKGQTIIYK